MTALTMAAVQLELAREDTDLLLHGDAANVHEDCTMSMFISMGLEIEELQYVVDVCYVYMLLTRSSPGDVSNTKR